MAPEPERSCIVTHAVKRKELIRFVIGPNDRSCPILRVSCRAGFVCTGFRLTLAEAIAKRAFSRAAKTQVHIPDDLSAGRGAARPPGGEVLSLARKSGQVVMGFDQVEAAVKSGKVEAPDPCFRRRRRRRCKRSFPAIPALSSTNYQGNCFPRCWERKMRSMRP